MIKEDLQQYLNDRRKLVNDYLIKILGRFDARKELIRAMDHSLMAGGKRLRPVLALAAARACGQNELTALPSACALEMIHTYSLIHDDLPAMDDDDLRRGLPTCHVKFGEATAILAGDALLTHAFYILAKPEKIFDIYPDAAGCLSLVALMSEAAGVTGMVEGQMMDLHSPANGAEPALSEKAAPGSLEYLETIHALKTGRMIRASVVAGALSVNASKDRIDALAGYADKIGLAFQVVDDILNIEGNPDVMGKAQGSDALMQKMTFPALIGLDASKKYARTLIKEACDCLSLFDSDASAPLQMIAQYIVDRDR